MPLFTADQLDRIRAIVRRYTVSGLGSMFGRPQDALTKELRDAGILAPTETASDLLSEAFDYGQLLGRTADMDLRQTSPEGVTRRLELNPAPPLGETEKVIVATARRHAAQYMTNLADRIAQDVMGQVTALEGNLTPDEVRAVVASETQRNREARASAKNLKSILGDRVGSWSRDWQRLATSEVNDLIQEGTAVALERDHDDPLVSKLPRPDACPDCKRLYLNGDGDPKVWKLSKLRANGTNVGRKRADWQPTVGNVHPWCGCQLVRVPPGMVWSDGELVPRSSVKKSLGNVHAWELDPDFRFSVEHYHDGALQKAGPYIGPRGGKWADPQHTIPWEEETHAKHSSAMNIQADALAKHYIKETFGSASIEEVAAAAGVDVGKPVEVKMTLEGQRLVVRAAFHEGGGNPNAKWEVGLFHEKIKYYVRHEGGKVEVFKKMRGSPEEKVATARLDIDEDGGIFLEDTDIDSVLGAAIEEHLEENFVSTPHAVRFFEPGGKSITNDSLFLPEGMQGQGLGTKMLASQVEAAARLGVKTLRTTATGRAGTPTRGYYVWPLLGYNAPLLEHGLPNDLRDAGFDPVPKDTHALFQMEGGREWWKKHGSSVKCEFDLTPGSNARLVLDAYVKTKLSKAEMADDVDEEMLARIWRALARRNHKLVKKSAFDDLDDLIKAAQHKYLRRIPTGKPKPKYRYIYSVDSIHHGNAPKVGEAIRVAHNGQVGHYHVTKVLPNGNVVAKHDETGDERQFSPQALHDLFNAHHREQIEEKHADLKDVHRAAKRHGSAKQKRAAAQRLADFQQRYDIDPDDKRDAIPATTKGRWQAYRAILDAAGINDHDSAQQDAAYLKARARGNVRDLPAFKWGGLDVFNEGTDRKKKLTSVFHGFEHAMRTHNIKSWRDIKPIVEMLRDVPGFGKARLPDDVLERHGQEDAAKRERENLTPEKAAPKQPAARAEPEEPARAPEGPRDFFDDEYEDFAFSDRSEVDLSKSIDAIVGPDAHATRVYLIRDDDDTAMLGFSSSREAEHAYGGKFESMTALSIERFNRVLKANGKELRIVKSVEPGHLAKSGGPFRGPRGGLYRDAALTKPWRESKGERVKRAAREVVRVLESDVRQSPHPSDERIKALANDVIHGMKGDVTGAMRDKVIKQVKSEWKAGTPTNSQLMSVLNRLAEEDIPGDEKGLDRRAVQVLRAGGLVSVDDNLKITLTDKARAYVRKSLSSVEPGHLAKAKFKRRWRGKGGRWEYEYDKDKPARTGAIHVDEEMVHDLAAQLTANWEVDKRGQVRKYGSPSSGFESVDVVGADGKKINVMVQAVWQPGDHGEDRQASGKARHVASHIGVRGELTVAFNPLVGADVDMMRREVRRVLTHELAHFADPALRKRAERKMARGEGGAGRALGGAHASEQAKAEYINEPAEITARIAEIVRDLRGHADTIRAWHKEVREDKTGWLKPFRADRQLGQATTRIPSPTFDAIAPYLTPKNRRRILVAAQATIDAIDEGRLSRVEKALIKGGHFGIRDGLDVALMQNTRPASPFLNIVQGTDDTPKKTRAAHGTGIADAMGYTPKGRRRVKSRSEEEQLEDLRRRWRAPEGRFWAIEGISGDATASAYENAADYFPEMLAEFRRQATKDATKRGKEKREKNIQRHKLRNEDSRVSDLTRDQRMAARTYDYEEGPHDVTLVKSGGPFIGPRGGKWADAAHTIPWHEDHEHIPHDEIKEHAAPAVHDEVRHAAHMAVAAGADPKSLKYVGAGGEGIVFEDNKGRAYKVPRFGKREKLRNEAEALRSLEGTEAAEFVPKVHAFKHGVIVRDKVEGKPGGWGAGKKISPVYAKIAAALKEKDWSAPEHKEDSFIFDDDGKPIMIDLGFVHPRGARAAARLDETFEKLTTDSDLLDIQFEQAALYNEGHLGWEKAKAQLDKVEQVFGDSKPDQVKYMRQEMERRAREKGDLK